MSLLPTTWGEVGRANRALASMARRTGVALIQCGQARIRTLWWGKGGLHMLCVAAGSPGHPGSRPSRHGPRMPSPRPCSHAPSSNPPCHPPPRTGTPLMTSCLGTSFTSLPRGKTKCWPACVPAWSRCWRRRGPSWPRRPRVAACRRLSGSRSVAYANEPCTQTIVQYLANNQPCTQTFMRRRHGSVNCGWVAPAAPQARLAGGGGVQQGCKAAWCVSTQSTSSAPGPGVFGSLSHMHHMPRHGLMGRTPRCRHAAATLCPLAVPRCRNTPIHPVTDRVPPGSRGLAAELGRGSG